MTASLPTSSPPLRVLVSPTARTPTSLPSSTHSTPRVLASPSRGVKRARESTSHGASTDRLPPASKRVHESPTATATSSKMSTPPSGGVVRVDSSLRISNEMLRTENGHLQAELKELRAFKSTADDQLSKQKQRIRNLEEDLTRIYRRQQREVDTRHAEHTKTVETLRHQLEALTKQLHDRPLITTIATETTQEMDEFVAMCVEWQAKLTALSGQLANQVELLETNAVSALMGEMVTTVEKTQVETAQQQLEIQWTVVRQQERDVQLLVEKIHRERQDMEAFEAMERRAMEERVADAEIAVKQSEDRSRELTDEVATLRDELATIRSGHRVIAEAEWQQQMDEDAHKTEQIEALSVQCEAQSVQLTLLREDLAGIQAENDELMADLAAHKQAATENGDALNKQLEDRLEELREQLAAAKKAVREAEAEVETLNSRVEVLTMNVEAKAKAIEALQVEKTQRGSREQELEQRTEQLESEVAELRDQLSAKAEESSGLEAELSTLRQEHDTKLDEARVEKSELHRQMTAKMCEWVELNREVKELKQQVETRGLEVRRLLQEKENQLVEKTTSATSRNDEFPSPSLSPEVQKRIARVVVEKNAVERFLHSYVDTAEAKCAALMAQVVQLETAQAAARRRVGESSELLQLCTQVEACDATIRASILDVVAALDSISR